MILAQTLSKVQRETGYNITQLANYTGVSRKTVNRILSHRTSANYAYRPAYNTVQSIAKSLGVSSDDLFKFRMDITTA